MTTTTALETAKTYYAGRDNADITLEARNLANYYQQDVALFTRIDGTKTYARVTAEQAERLKEQHGYYCYTWITPEDSRISYKYKGRTFVAMIEGIEIPCTKKAGYKKYYRYAQYKALKITNLLKKLDKGGISPADWESDD